MTVFKTCRLAAGTRSFAGKGGRKKERKGKKETLQTSSSLFVAVYILRIAVRTRLMHATTMRRAFMQPGQARFMVQNKGDDDARRVVSYKGHVYNQIC